MNRLPPKFEDEVLSKHGIRWLDIDLPDYHTFDRVIHEYVHAPNGFMTGMSYPGVSPYEIASIGMEALKSSIKHCALYFDANDIAIWGWSFGVNGSFEHEDYCECVFMAIWFWYTDKCEIQR